MDEKMKRTKKKNICHCRLASCDICLTNNCQCGQCKAFREFSSDLREMVDGLYEDDNDSKH